MGKNKEARASSHASAEACLMGWSNARPQGWKKVGVAQHHRASRMM